MDMWIEVSPKVSPKISKLVGISVICQCQNPMNTILSIL